MAEHDPYAGCSLSDRLQLLAFEAELAKFPRGLIAALWEAIDGVRKSPLEIFGIEQVHTQARPAATGGVSLHHEGRSHVERVRVKATGPGAKPHSGVTLRVTSPAYAADTPLRSPLYANGARSHLLHQAAEVVSDEVSVVHRGPQIGVTHRLFHLHRVPAGREPGRHPPVAEVMLVEVRG